jgi:hypothetical protein
VFLCETVFPRKDVVLFVARSSKERFSLLIATQQILRSFVEDTRNSTLSVFFLQIVSRIEEEIIYFVLDSKRT